METRDTARDERALGSVASGGRHEPTRSAANDAHAAAHRSFGRAVGWLGAGAVIGSCVLLARASSPAVAPPGNPVAWVTDRDGHELIGLDPDLLVARSTPIPWPLEVESTRDGGVWVLRSANGQPGASVRLVRLAADGTAITTLFLDQAEGLDVLDGEQALVLSREGNDVRVLRVRTEGSWFVVHAGPDVRCAAASRGSVLVGTSTGVVRRIDPATALVVDELQLEDPVPVDDVEPGPTPGTAWVLAGGGTGRLYLVNEDLTVRWATGVGFACRSVAGVPGQERAWIGAENAGRLVRIGPNGVFELDVSGLPAVGLGALVPWRKGGVLALTPGAVLNVTSTGTLAPGQGGFAWLSDAARVR